MQDINFLVLVLAVFHRQSYIVTAPVDRNLERSRIIPLLLVEVGKEILRRLCVLIVLEIDLFGDYISNARRWCACISYRICNACVREGLDPGSLRAGLFRCRRLGIAGFGRGFVFGNGGFGDGPFRRRRSGLVGF